MSRLGQTLQGPFHVSPRVDPAASSCLAGSHRSRCGVSGEAQEEHRKRLKGRISMKKRRSDTRTLLSW